MSDQTQLKFLAGSLLYAPCIAESEVHRFHLTLILRLAYSSLGFRHPSLAGIINCLLELAYASADSYPHLVVFAKALR